MLAGIFICIVIIASFYILNIWYKRTNAYNNLQSSMKKYRNIENGIEFVNIGSGPSYYAFDYRDRHVKGFNFASAPQSVYHDYALLHHYKEKIEKGAIIIIITCPLSFCRNKFHGDRDYRCKYYGVLNAEEVDGGTKLEAFLYKHFPLTLYPKRIIRLIRDTGPVSVYASQVKSLKEDAKRMMEGWKKNNEVKDLMDQTQSTLHQEEFNKKIKVYKKMLQLCEDQGWKAYFVIPPVSQPVCEMISKEFKQRFILDNIQEANIYNVPVLDYSFDERMIDDKYYLTCMFLNETGKKRFWEIIVEDLKQYD